MIKMTFVGFVVVGLLSGVSVAQAESVNVEMSPDQIATYCASAGNNTTAPTTIAIGGKSFTGSIRCAHEDTSATVADNSDTEVGQSEAAEINKGDGAEAGKSDGAENDQED